MAAVFLQAQSCVCALGDTPEAIRAGLWADAPGGVAPTELHTPGRVLHLGAVATPLPSLEGLPQKQRSRNNALLLAALAPLRARIQAAVDRFGPRRVAVVLGVSTAGLDEGVAAVRQMQAGFGWPAGYDYALQEMGNAAECVARQLGTSGPAYVISTACSSGAKALATGARLLRTGPSSRPIRNSAAPSPMLMPLRLADSGLQRSADTASSAENPAIVKPLNASPPPATTASAWPERSSRAPVAIALAPDEQAVEIT